MIEWDFGNTKKNSQIIYTFNKSMTQVSHLVAEEILEYLNELGLILKNCVETGASVSFLAPFALEQGISYFRAVAEEVRAQRAILLAAFLDGKLSGTVQLRLSMPPNQPHRAEVAKLLVDPAARNRGLGRLLMMEVELVARRAGKTLLVLDTEAAGSAVRLYDALGYQRVGVIPNFALRPDGAMGDTLLYFKELSASR